MASSGAVGQNHRHLASDCRKKPAAIFEDSNSHSKWLISEKHITILAWMKDDAVAISADDEPTLSTLVMTNIAIEHGHF